MTAEDNCPPGTPRRNNSEVLWGYDMAMGGPATALALFFLVTLVIIAQLIVGRNRNTYYMITLVLAGLAEGGGYAAAVDTVINDCKTDLFNPFLAAQVLILLMPNFVEATMYTTTSKISAFGQVPREQFWLRPSFISWFYITSDIVTVLVQAAGIGIWGSARTSDDEDDPDQVQRQADIGAWIVVAGLILQIVSQSIFMLEALYVQYKMDKAYQALPETRALFFSVYLIWTFLQIRNIYRLVAFIQQSVAEDTDTGGSGKSAGEIEPVFFIFEALMILLSIIPFAVYPPSFLLPRASAKKAEKRGQSSECIDSEKNEDEKEDLRADVPEFYRQYVLGPFERYPWLGKVF